MTSNVAEVAMAPTLQRVRKNKITGTCRQLNLFMNVRGTLLLG